MEWVSVEDKLPDNNEKVLTKDNLGREVYCTFFFHENMGGRAHFKVNGYAWEHSNVTHWKRAI